MAWAGKDLKTHPIPVPCCGQGCHHQLMLPRAPSNLVLNTSTDGAPTASLGCNEVSPEPSLLQPSSSVCLHRRGAPALWSSWYSSGPVPTVPHVSCAFHSYQMKIWTDYLIMGSVSSSFVLIKYILLCIIINHVVKQFLGAQKTGSQSLAHSFSTALYCPRSFQCLA